MTNQTVPDYLLDLSPFLDRPTRPARPRGRRLKHPEWLPATAAKTWRRVVDGLHQAGVDLQAIDAEAIGFFVTCIDGARDAAAASDQKLVARFSRDALAWAALIGATPAARRRMGLGS